jgi:hypothetical protein
MTVLLLLPNGEARVYELDEAVFDTYKDCMVVGKAVQSVRSEVIAFECKPYTEA